MSFQERVQARAPWRRIPGIQVGAVSERPTGIDERVAVIFRDMRVGLDVSVAELAHALGTTAAVIETLESGQVRAFPAWPETVRIVSELGKLHRVDARPILARIRDQVGPAGLGQIPQTAPASRTPAQKHPLLRIRDRAAAPKRETRREGPPRVRKGVRRAARALFAISTPVALCGALMWLAQTQPAFVLGSVGALPEPAARIARPAIELSLIHI